MFQFLSKSKQKCAKVKILKRRSFPANTAKWNTRMVDNLVVISQGLMEIRLNLQKKKRANLNKNLNQNNLVKGNNNQEAHRLKLEE